MLNENAKKFDEKKDVSSLPVFQGNTYFIDSAIAGQFSFFWDYAIYRVKEIFHFFEQYFSQFLVFEVCCEGNVFAEF